MTFSSFRMVYSGGSTPPPSPQLHGPMVTVTEEPNDINDKDKATERVAHLLGDDLERRDLFCQMDVLREYRDDMVWKEMARLVLNLFSSAFLVC